MSKSRMIITLGALVALMPILGFPRFWEGVFQVFAGLAIIGISIWSTIDRKLAFKAKAQMRTRKAAPIVASQPEVREAPTEEPPKVPEATPTSGKRVTDFYPKTAPPGRRASDLRASAPSPLEEPNDL